MNRWLGAAMVAMITSAIPAKAAEQSGRAEVTRGLVAQADLAKVRERRLADDRELALITGYTARIGALQQQFGS